MIGDDREAIARRSFVELRQKRITTAVTRAVVAVAENIGSEETAGSGVGESQTRNVEREKTRVREASAATGVTALRLTLSLCDPCVFFHIKHRKKFWNVKPEYGRLQRSARLEGRLVANGIISLCRERDVRNPKDVHLPSSFDASVSKIQR
jgi:hypothetical protein